MTSFSPTKNVRRSSKSSGKRLFSYNFYYKEKSLYEEVTRKTLSLTTFTTSKLEKGLKNCPIRTIGGDYLLKAIGYIRVSTEEQSADDKYGIEVQRQAISEYAKSEGYEVTDWMVDTISGAKDNRPELDKILYQSDQLPPHDAVIVFKNDRVARDTKLYFYYFYTLEKRNVRLLSAEEHFSEGDDFANIYRSLLMFVAEQERKNIALRTGKGRSLKAKCGGYSGGNKPYGYYVVDGMLMLDPKERPIVETVFREHDQNETSLLDICDILYDGGYRTRKGKRFQPSTIRGILSNRPFYEGKYKYGDMGWVQGVHTPILPLEV